MQDHEKHPHHHWLLAMLGGAITLLIVILGYFGYQLFTGKTITPIKRAQIEDIDYLQKIQEQQDDILEIMKEDEAETQEEEEEISTLTFTGSSISPEFSYPATWHIFSSQTFSQQEGVVNTIFVGPEPIMIIEATDAPPSNIQMSVISKDSYDLSEYATYLDLIVAAYTGEFTSGLTVTSSPHLNGTLSYITGRQVGGLGADHDFELVVYETESTALFVSFRDYIEGEEDNEVWEAMKKSFDVSLLQ